MENIIEPSSDFNFSQLNLENPAPLQGGNFFTKINYTDKQLPLYIQLPKCISKHGIIKNPSSKKSYIDIMFNYYESDLISWFENLEIKCRELIYSKKDIWFQTELTLDDIENMFISPIKSYKSGKFITIRVHIPHTKHIKKDYCMIYDENERILDSNVITESTQFIPLICIDGIKFSSKSFQLDINLPQIMVLSMKDEIKNECMIKHAKVNKNNLEKSNNLEDIEKKDLEKNKIVEKDHLEKSKIVEKDDLKINKTLEKQDLEINKILEKQDLDKEYLGKDNIELKQVNNDDNKLEEVEISVDDNDNNISLKKQNDIYYEIYKSAKDKAKHMKQAALEAYLEVKNIKTKYMLNEINSSDDEISNFSENEG